MVWGVLDQYSYLLVRFVVIRKLKISFELVLKRFDV